MVSNLPSGVCLKQVGGHMKVWLCSLTLLVLMGACGSQTSSRDQLAGGILQVVSSGKPDQSDLSPSDVKVVFSVGDTWANSEVGLTVTEKGADLQFSCGSGNISEQIILDQNGSFSVKGTEIQNRGPMGENTAAKEVLYAGSINMDTKEMTLLIEEEACFQEGCNGVRGPFVLQYKADPNVNACVSSF